MHRNTKRARRVQWFFILLLLLAGTGGYFWYRSKAGVTINSSHTTDLTSGLVGYWTFDGADTDWSASTTEIKDKSGSNNHGDYVGNGDTTYTANGTYTPVTNSVTVQTWGGGGAGGGTQLDTTSKGGAGAGGAYARKIVPVTPYTSYTVTVGGTKTNATTGDGSQGNPSWFGSVSTVYAEGGAGGLSYENGGTAGTGSSAASIGDTVYAGGNGSNGGATSTGGAGGGAGSTGAGGNASGNTAGTGTTVDGGAGGAGWTSQNNGAAGTAAGGGGGGGYATSSTDRNGGTGARGQVIVTESAKSVEGKLGQGLAFNGTSDYVQTATPVDITGTKAVSMWFKPANGNDRVLFYASDGTGNDFCVIERSPSKIEVSTDNVYTPSKNRLASVTTTTGQWYHIVINKTAYHPESIYLNGVPLIVVDDGGFYGAGDNLTQIGGNTFIHTTL